MGRSRSRGRGAATSAARTGGSAGSGSRRFSPSPAAGKRRGAGGRSPSAGTGRGRLRSWSRSQERVKGSSSRADSGGAPAAKPPPSHADLKNKPLKRQKKEIFGKELGYSDASNPFGDAGLSDKFVWKKKNEYLAAAGLYRQSSKDQDLQRIEGKIQEIHSVKKRRDEREVEKRLLEKQRMEHDKEKHDEEFDEWVEKEEYFHLENAKVRSLIRIDQGRERPIDLVSKSLAIAEGEEFEDMTILDKQPHQMFVHMGLEEVEEMMPEIECFVRNDRKHADFWKAMLYCCRDALTSKGREKAGTSRPGSAMSGLGAGVAEGVIGEIHELLCSKSQTELEEMLVEIKKNMQVDKSVDTQFFDAVASKIPLYIARAEIEEWHTQAKRKSDTWTDAQNDMEAPVAPVAPKKPAANAAAANNWDDLPDGNPEGDDFSPELEPLSMLDDKPEIRVKGAYSPMLEPLGGYEEQDLLDPMEDERILIQVRNTLIEAFGGRVTVTKGGKGVDRSNDDALFQQESSKGCSKDEVGFNAMGKGTGDDYHGELELKKASYEWEDKYKPRKPRFFNRVKTGYEWNKYNQTHYDHDNPPPKQVQGYKFNVFYPDLVDKAVAPKYYIEKADTPETCILRFHAGPPYEDVAFKIVNREWHLSSKFGFRVVFDRGVLQLYFNFKRWRYRR